MDETNTFLTPSPKSVYSEFESTIFYTSTKLGIDEFENSRHTLQYSLELCQLIYKKL
jgi:hypothetical protein